MTIDNSSSPLLGGENQQESKTKSIPVPQQQQQQQSSSSSNSSTTTTTTTTSTTTTTTAFWYMALLALQFGIQPILTRRYTPSGIVRSTVVLAQEICKFFFALLALVGTKSPQTPLLPTDWSLSQWLQVAGFPAALYAVQNIAALEAYQNLDALTFNVLNQTKTLSAALCCYLILGQRQSFVQMAALVLLLFSALILEKMIALPWDILQESSSLSTTTTTTLWWSDWNWFATAMTTTRFSRGVAPILLASFISGLAGALSQLNLQKSTGGGGGGGGRNPYLFSAELCVASASLLTVSLLVSPDGRAIQEHGFFYHWTPSTWIPIITQSLGGILVGLVTKYAGSVQKGFALIFGIWLSGLIQAVMTTAEERGGSGGGGGGVGLSPHQIWGGILAGVSLYLHAVYPPPRRSKIPPASKADKQD